MCTGRASKPTPWTPYALGSEWLTSKPTARGQTCMLLWWVWSVSCLGSVVILINLRQCHRWQLIHSWLRPKQNWQKFADISDTETRELLWCQLCCNWHRDRFCVLRPANKRRHIVTSSLIGSAHTKMIPAVDITTLSAANDNKDGIMMTLIFQDAFSWRKTSIFWFQVHWNLFLMVLLTISQQ